MTFGAAPILDFDGTIAHLGVDWVGLRRSLNVERIDELWSRPGDWSVVAVEEIKAAAHAVPVAPVIERLSAVRCFSVLTSNDSVAVLRFFDRFPPLKRRLRMVVGREELGGPKTEFTRFESGVLKCLSANRQEQTQERSVYVGDSQFELEFALRLGLNAIDVAELMGD